MLKDGPLGYMHVIDKPEQELPNLVEDPKLIKKVVHGQSIFVLMASSQKNVTVEKV